MGTRTPTPPDLFLWCHGAPAPGRAARAARVLEAASRDGLCRTHAFCATPTGLSALVTCASPRADALRSCLRSGLDLRVRTAPVGSALQARVLVSHLDAEPVRACVEADPRRYAHGSLGLRHGGTGTWLEDAWLAAEAAQGAGYHDAFPALSRPGPTAALAARLARVGGDRAPLDAFATGLLGAASAVLLERLEQPGVALAPVVPAQGIGAAGYHSPGRRQIVLLRALGGLSADEIARASGSTTGAVATELRDVARCLASAAPALAETTASACELAAGFYARWLPDPTCWLPRPGFGRAAGAPRGISA